MEFKQSGTKHLCLLIPSALNTFSFTSNHERKSTSAGLRLQTVPWLLTLDTLRLSPPFHAVLSSGLRSSTREPPGRHGSEELSKSDPFSYPDSPCKPKRNDAYPSGEQRKRRQRHVLGLAKLNPFDHTNFRQPLGFVRYNESS